jgi:hypothetical protein
MIKERVHVVEEMGHGIGFHRCWRVGRRIATQVRGYRQMIAAELPQLRGVQRPVIGMAMEEHDERAGPGLPERELHAVPVGVPCGEVALRPRRGAAQPDGQRAHQHESVEQASEPHTLSPGVWRRWGRPLGFPHGSPPID